MNDNYTTDGLFEFPCPFPIKIMGPADHAFEARMVGIIRKHSPSLGEGAVKVRHSKAGTYIAITATINAQNRNQLDALYRELTADKEVLMVL